MIFTNSDLDVCDYLHIKPKDKETSDDKIIEIKKSENNKNRYFIYKQKRYNWIESKFKENKFNTNISFEEITNKYQSGHSEKSYKRFLDEYGCNELYIPVKSYLYLVLVEVSSPFYIFQIFSSLLWIYEKYFGKSFFLNFFTNFF